MINKGKGATKVVKATWPAIIDVETFNKVKERLRINKCKYKPDEWKTYPFPLTELLVCGECGKNLGGKSGHGRNGRHFYYGHPRRLNSDGVTHLKRCSLENVRAPRMEELILQSLKKLVNDNALLKTWLDIYAERTHSELPALEGRLKNIDTEIVTQQRRLENLTLRLADLPKEMSADQIYNQIKTLTAKQKVLETTRDELQSQNRQLSSGVIDSSELMFRVRRTIMNLEKTPVEARRPIFSNLIKFAELYPTKIRLGVYAPTVSVALTDYRKVAGSCKDEFGRS